MQTWNPWHGCHRISPGCAHCYMFSRDAEFGKDSTIVTRTSTFDMPIKRKRNGSYKLEADGDAVFTCGTSDFFIEEADAWRQEAWEMIRLRSDLRFMIVTKRIHRFLTQLPKDWGEGYENVIIACTCENQKMANERIPVFLEMPIRHRLLIHEPMLEPIAIRQWLDTGLIEGVICGGESGAEARECNFAWILNTMNQCVEAEVPFHFKQTGAVFRKGGKVYHVERKFQMSQAAKAGVDYRWGMNEEFSSEQQRV